MWEITSGPAREGEIISDKVVEEAWEAWEAEAGEAWVAWEKAKEEAKEEAEKEMEASVEWGGGEGSMGTCPTEQLDG